MVRRFVFFTLVLAIAFGLISLAAPAQAAGSSTPTPAPSATVIGRVHTFRLIVRSGPARTFKKIGMLTEATTVTLVGRNKAGTWLQLQSGGWVAAVFVVVNGKTKYLPITG